MSTETRPDRSDFSTDARWSFVILGGRAVASLLFVLAASRALGSGGFGYLAALSALTSVSLVITTSGVAYAATMFASRSTHPAGSILRASVRSAAAMVVLVVIAYLLVVSIALPGVSVTSALMLFGADVLVVGLGELIGSVFLGLRCYARAAMVWGVVSGGRVFAAGIVAIGSMSSISQVTGAAFAAAIVAVPALVVLGRPLLSRTGPTLSARQITRTGAIFTVGSLVGRVNNDFDKVFLAARLGAVDVVGTYAAGYRVVEYSMLPLGALATAALPRFFRAGAAGLAAARGVARRLALAYLGTGLALTLGLLLARGAFEQLFGPSYGGLSTVVGMLALMPVLRSMVNLLAEPLTGADRQHLRVAVMGAALVVNIVVNVALLDRLGWTAAVWATYASEGTQLLLLVAIALRGRAHSGSDVPV